MEWKKPYKDQPGFDEFLRAEYCDKEKTMRQIGEEIGCSAAAVMHNLRRCGIEARKLTDYPPTERQRECGRKLGYAGKGKKLTEEQRKRISEMNKGRRARDYEFGGHEKMRDDGYIAVYVPDHPHANKEGYVMKHRLVVERDLGILIPEDHVVHHINGNRADNRIDNLALMTFEAHSALHMHQRHERRKNNEHQ